MLELSSPPMPAIPIPEYLSNVYNRHKEPSERLLEKLGFTRQTAYVRSPTAASREKKK